jgi:zinc transport system substrate-binding protein
MKKKDVFGVVILVILFGILFIAGCSSQNQQVQKTQKNIVAVTIAPQRTFAQEVCKDLADVIVIVPAGSSPATYEPTPMQMEELNSASVYFTIGVPAEKANILTKTNEKTKIVKLEDEVAKLYPDRIFEEGQRDPHIWLSPKRAKVMVETMAKEMSNIDPVNKEKYESNAKSYIEKLDQLDNEVKTLLQGVENKKFIVFHPAFGYFADDYGLQMFALEKEGKEATPEHLKDMIDLAKSENIKAIFYQEEIDSKQSKAFAEQLGGKAVQLSPLSENYIDNLKQIASLIKEVIK